MNAQSKWPDDFFTQQVGIHHFYRAWKLEHEFVERWPGENPSHTRNFFEFGLGEPRFCQILQRLLAQAFLAKQTKVNRSRQRVQRFVSANVRSSLFAANVLFASRQREDESAASLCIIRLARQPAGHLANV